MAHEAPPQLLEIEAQNSKEAQAATSQERLTRCQLIHPARQLIFTVLGLLCVSMVLVWPEAPTAIAKAARITGKSLRQAAVRDPKVQFLPGSSSPLAPKSMGSSEPRSRVPLPLQPATPLRPVSRPFPQVAPLAQSYQSSDPAVFNRQPGESEIKTFLTQRALQNLITLLNIERDQITADWLEAFKGHEGIRHYHGLSGLHMGGRAYVDELLRAPNEELTVEFKRRGNGGHGGSPDRAAALGAEGNPYLKDHVFEFKEKIEPRRLADRLMRLRTAIAEEWIEDLKLLRKENDETWRSFFETVRENEDKLKNLQMPVFPHRADEIGHTTFRGGNYDLLRRLATYDAGKQLRADYQRSAGAIYREDDKVKADFVDSMLKVYASQFEGDNGHFNTDETFIAELLARPPSIVGSVLLSPLGIVEQICEVRVQIAEEWIVELQDVHQEQMDMQIKLLEASLPHSMGG